MSGHKIGLSKSYYKVETDDGTQKIFQPVDNKSSEPQFAINDDGLILIDIPFYSSYNKESLDKEMVDKALRIQSIITTAKSVRFLFIESKESIESTRGEDFKKLFKSIGNFIPLPILRSQIR